MWAIISGFFERPEFLFMLQVIVQRGLFAFVAEIARHFPAALKIQGLGSFIEFASQMRNIYGLHILGSVIHIVSKFKFCHVVFWAFWQITAEK